MENKYGNKQTTSTGTDIQQVKQQNKQPMTEKGVGSSQFGTEFGSETNAQEVKKQNQKSEQNKK